MSFQTISRTSPPGSYLTSEQALNVIAEACPVAEYRGKRVLLIVPDATRTCPSGMLFRGIFDQIGAAATALDVMIALGTHQPMSEEAICRRLEISLEERQSKYGTVRLFNHEWDNPSALKHIGTISAGEINELSGGLFAMDVPVNVNRRLFDYDQIIIAGPVFPHEVVGFSGGNKYLFPGVSGPEVLNFFHWLGAVVTNPMIIGNKYTPVRKVVDRAGSMVTLPKLCFCMVVEHAHLAGLFAGSPENAWDQYKEISWGVLAHSTHVRGIGTYANGIEHCRVQVTLATGIPRELCAEINLGYRNPSTIDPKEFANREAEGVLLVPKAGEMLYHLRKRPDWAREM
jgi:hypothetical protein